MRSLKIFGTAVAAILALAACNKEPENTEEEHDEAYYAALATIGSADAAFSSTDKGGTINFKTAGGTVVVDVDCGCNWIAENEASDIFPSKYDTAEGLLTVTASQNTVEQELSSTITLMTADSRIEFATLSIIQSAYGAPEIIVSTNEWHAPAVGALSTEITVESSIGDYKFEVSDDWLTAEETDSGLSLTAEENESEEGRNATVVLTADDGIRVVTETINVNQDGTVYLTLSDDAVVLGSEEGSTTVTVETNFDWEFSYDSSNGWLTMDRGDDGIVVSVSENSGSERSEVVTVTSGDGAENVAQAQFTVTQSDAKSLIFTFTTLNAEYTRIGLPISGTVNCTVDWGDGTVESITSTHPYHEYYGAGEYNVVVNGTVTEISSNELGNSTENYNNMKYLTGIKQWGATGLTSMYRAFYYCTQLTSVPTDRTGAFADVTTFEEAFYHSGIEEIPEGFFDHCTKVENLSRTFESCTSLKTLPKKLFPECPLVEELYYTFYCCTSLEAFPEGILDGCTGVKTFTNTFDRCSTVVAIPTGILDHCTEAVTLKNLFYECSAITSIPSGLFDNCTKVTSFEGTFRMTGITSIPSGLFDKCTEATDFTYTFCACASLTSIPTGLFAKCPNAKTFECTFGTSGITSIPSGLFDSCSAATSFNNAFSYCSSLTEIPEGLFDDCTAVTDFKQCFAACPALTSVPSGLFDNCKSVKDFSFMMYNCTGLTCESPYTMVDGEKVHLYERSESNGFTAPTTYGSCFKNATGLTDYDDIPSGWK